MKHFATSLLLSTALAFTCSGVLLAAEIDASPYIPVDKQTALVKYSDLNLAHSADAQILLHRVGTLSSKLCERQSDIRQLNAAREQKRCVEKSYSYALGSINRQTGVDIEALAARAAVGREVVVAE